MVYWQNMVFLETLADHSVEELSGDVDFTVYCTKTITQKDQWPANLSKGAKLVYSAFDANGIQSIVYDCIAFFWAPFADVLLILGGQAALCCPLSVCLPAKNSYHLH